MSYPRATDAQLHSAVTADVRVGVAPYAGPSLAARPIAPARLRAHRRCAVSLGVSVGGAAPAVHRRDGRQLVFWIACLTLNDMSPRVLVVDNYDSFVYNLVQYLA